jgi:glutaredoxin 3
MAKIEIYSRRSCGYCHAALAVLDDKDLEYQEYDVQLDQARYMEMLSRTGRSSVPQIFINNRHFGGYRELILSIESGEFDTLINSAQDANNI